MQHLIQTLNRYDIEQTDELLCGIRRAVIKDQLAKPENTQAMTDIMNAVCKVFNLMPSDIIGKRRFRRIATARHMFAYIARKSGHSLRDVGYVIGGRHHSSIIHDEHVAQDLIDTDEEFRHHLSQVTDLLSPQNSTT